MNVNRNGKFEGKGNFYVEIGFGNGDFTIFLAKTHPDATVVGIEVSGKCVEKLKKKAERDGMGNLIVLRMDGRHALSTLFLDSSIDGIYFNFPDPWWKKRHRERRLFSEDFIRLLWRKLKNGGYVEIATDHLEYMGKILRNFEKFGYFRPGFGRYPLVTFLFNREPTRYEEKYRMMGKTITYLRFIKP